MIVRRIPLDRDFSEFVACCVARDVRFLIVGGYALAAHGHPRFTKDLDLWGVARRRQRCAVDRCTRRLRLRLARTRDYRLRRARHRRAARPRPKRIDLLTSIDGVMFDECWPDHGVLNINGLEIPFIDVDHLIVNKCASGRHQDLADAEALTTDGADQDR